MAKKLAFDRAELPKNTGESGTPGVPLPVSTPTTGAPAMKPGDPSRTQPAMTPAPPEKEPRPFGGPPPDKTRR